MMLSRGGIAVLFCHIHHMTMKQVKNKIEQVIKDKDIPLQLKKNFTLKADCLPKKGFPEGAYLKCLVFEK